MSAYERARAELQSVREEMERVSDQILTAAEEQFPGIAERFETLRKKEIVLKGLAVKAAVEAEQI